MAVSKLYYLLFVGVCVYLLLPFRSANTNRAATIGMPGVGISFTVDYAVLSLRKEDGSFQDVGRVESTPEYRKMMFRLGREKASHAAPPYETMEELWSDYARQLLRQTRKSIGLAASSDVAVLSRMLDQILHLQSQSLPGDSFQKAQIPVVISYPGLPGLHHEDIADAALYLGVQLHRGHELLYQPHNLVAGYAGYGLGLCKTFRDKEACRLEGLAMPVREVLLAECTENALHLHTNIMREAHDLASRDISLSSGYGLGGAGGKANDIETAVGHHLWRKYGEDRVPEKIVAIMTGSDVNEELLEGIRRGVANVGAQLEILNEDAEYIAARGAAEMAWRSLQSGEEAEL